MMVVARKRKYFTSRLKSFDVRHPVEIRLRHPARCPRCGQAFIVWFTTHNTDISPDLLMDALMKREFVHVYCKACRGIGGSDE